MRRLHHRLLIPLLRGAGLATSVALALGHLWLLGSRWSQLSWTQASLLLLATALCGVLAAVHRSLFRRPALLLIVVLAGLVAHPPTELDSPVSAAIVPTLLILAAAALAPALERQSAPEVTRPLTRRGVRQVIPAGPELVTPHFSRPPPPRT
ncbi:MAG: hypothetical protein HUU25_00980 [Candidatus Sumerlaeia bacterium]|nr:hypothetical protein [Candidatus Sumerlaeia bacterium]